MTQRMEARNNYDKTICEIESSYNSIVMSSERLLGCVEKEYGALESIMDKKVGTVKEEAQDEAKYFLQFMFQKRLYAVD